MAGEREFQIRLSTEQWEWIVENELRGELLDLVESCTAETIVARCQEEFGFEPTLRLTGVKQNDILTDKSKPFTESKTSLVSGLEPKGVLTYKSKPFTGSKAAPVSGNRAQRRAQKRRK